MRKNLLPLYFVITAVIFGLGYFVSIYKSGAGKTVPKIKLSYFPTVSEMAETVLGQLETELRGETQYWIGIEPQKQAHLQFAEELILLLKSQKKVTQIFIDEQLELKGEALAALSKAFPELKIFPVKEKWFELSELYKKNEMNNTAIVTAAIYSTSMLPNNPLDKIKKGNPEFKPVTFSSGHLALSTLDEQNNIFPCSTEDKTGTNTWGCAVINKARAQRRKLQPFSQADDKKYLGLMDLTDEKNYMVLLTERKR